MTPLAVQRSQTRVAIVSLFILAVAIAALGAMYVYRRQEIIRLGYELATATTQRHRLDDRTRRLEVELGLLTDPARIERLAKELGMAPPAPGQIRVVKVPAQPKQGD